VITTDALEFRVGLAAVQAAARLTEAVRHEMVSGAGAGRLDKEDRSPVTVADFGAQALVARALEAAFPYDVLVAEETSAALREPANAALLIRLAQFVRQQVQEATEENVTAWIDRGAGAPGGRFWVLDPIDGTKGFLRDDQYAVALALLDHDTVKWGFLACPALTHKGQPGVIFVAQQNEGAEAYTLDGTRHGPVTVSEVMDPAAARLVESVESVHTNFGLSGSLKQILGITTPTLAMDSQAKYAAVARGEAEIYLRSPNAKTPHYREFIWDHAAGWLVVTEAGGRVSDVRGQPLDWTRGRRLETNLGVVATNGHLHDAVVEALAHSR
jgi:3'(2'), 5'-bisphosphate nucleotidase